MMTRKLWTGMVAAALIIVVIGLRVGSARDATPTADSSAARILGARDVELAGFGRVEAGIAISGSLDPYRVVEVRAQLPGTIERVFVDRGVPVREGQVLALHDPATVRGQLAGADAAVAAARSAVLAATHEEEAAEALYPEGALSERDLRQARSAAAAARAELKAAEARLVEAREAEARVRVTAPVAGVVSRRAVSAGEAVSPGQPLFTVVDTDTLELAARVPAHQIAGVAVGKRVVFSIDAYPGRRFEGYIARVDAVADAATRQVAVYTYLPNDRGELVGGLYATGRILSEAADSVVSVSREGVRGSADAPYVLVVENGKVGRRDVVLGPRDAVTGRVAVREGLAAGATVIVGPEGGLAPGTLVELRPSPAAAGEVAR
jgi:membrane fusion protein, multidrug efflux system